MSFSWSEVAMMFRIEAVKPEMPWETEEAINFEQIFGKRYTRDQEDHYLEYPHHYLPRGLKGALQMTVWKNPDEFAEDRYVVSIFGSLKHFEDYQIQEVEKLVAWFNHRCSSEQLDLRQASLTIQNNQIGTITKTY